MAGLPRKVKKENNMKQKIIALLWITGFIFVVACVIIAQFVSFTFTSLHSGIIFLSLQFFLLDRHVAANAEK